MLRATLKSTNYSDSAVRHVMTKLRKVDNQWCFVGVQEDDLLKK
ncbi:MAG TPA: hypothetical protein PLH67_09345 [Lentisphaeria bacterium]|nr:hypothetical protein [Lentisphaeria bacterium]